MTARIYKPAKTAMQSGRGNTKEWVVEFEQTTPKQHDPLMGWTSSADTQQQVKLYFATKEEASAYCARNALDYVLQEPRERRLKPKAYADNFRWTPRARS